MMTMLPATPILGEASPPMPMPSNQSSGNQVNGLGEATSPFDISALPTPGVESEGLQPGNFMTFHEVMASNIPSTGSSLYGQPPSDPPSVGLPTYDPPPVGLPTPNPSPSNLPPSGSSLAGLPSASSPAGIPDSSHSQIASFGTESDPSVTLSQNGTSLSQNNTDTSVGVPGGHMGDTSATNNRGSRATTDRSGPDTESQHSPTASQHDMNGVAGAAGGHMGSTANGSVGQVGANGTETNGTGGNVGSQGTPGSISTSGNQTGGNAGQSNAGQSSAGSGWADANSANSSGSSGQSHVHVGNSSNSGQPVPQGAQMAVATLDALLGSLAESAGYVGDAVVTVSPDATPAQVAAEIVSVLVPLQSSGNGAGSVTIRLDPPGMGSISAMVEASASGLSVHFQTDNVHAHELLNQVLQDIKEHLSSGTSGTVSVTISWGGVSGGMTGHGSHGMSSGSGHRSGVGETTKADTTSNGVLPESTTSNGSATKRLLDVRL